MERFGRKMKVVVLAGGTSTERDVSLISGSMIYKALKKNGHQAMLLDVYLSLQTEEYILSLGMEIIPSPYSTVM